MNVELHPKFLHIVAFSILRIAYLIQKAIGDIFWEIITIRYVNAAWKISGKKLKDKTKLIVFRRDIKFESIIGSLIRPIIIFNSSLYGLKTERKIFNFLISWNPSIPLISIKYVIFSYELRWLGEPETIEDIKLYPREAYANIGKSEKQGTFKIVQKIIDSNKVIIECVWLSGNHIGEKFTIGLDSKHTQGHLPECIYFPPRIITFFLECIASITVVSVILGLTYKAIQFIFKYYEAIWLNI